MYKYIFKNFVYSFIFSFLVVSIYIYYKTISIRSITFYLDYFYNFLNVLEFYEKYYLDILIEYITPITLFLMLLNYLKIRIYNGMKLKQYIQILELPKNFNLFNQIKNDDKTLKIYDKVILIFNKTITIKNNTKIDFERYNQLKDDLEQYLGMNIYNIKKLPFNKIKIICKDPFSSEVFNEKQLKEDKVYFGKSLKNGDVYISLKDFTHFFIVGQSGSGKSVFQNLLINQFIFNLLNGKLHQLVLVDLKGGVEFNQYKTISNKIIVIDNVEKLNKLLNYLVKTMNKRIEIMKQKGIKNWEENQIFVVIDEYQSIKDQENLLDKDTKKELNSNLRTLLSKSRSSGIKFLVSTQKGTSDNIDTTIRENLQTKILLRTISKDGQKSVLGDLEVIKNLGVDPSRFTKGRYILFSETFLDLCQSPFINENFYKTFLKDDEIQRDYKKRDNKQEEVNCLTKNKGVKK